MVQAASCSEAAARLMIAIRPIFYKLSQPEFRLGCDTAEAS